MIMRLEWGWLDRRGCGKRKNGAGSVFLNGVLLEKDGDESGGGDGDESADDAGESGSEEEGDEDSEAHEIDAGAHDARGEDRIFDVDVDDVEDDDANHLCPGVECGDERGECDGDGAAGDGNDVEESHEKAEKDEVADVEKAEDDGAGDSKDEHESTLADEPLADFAFCFFQGVVEANALWFREEGEEESVGVFPFEHEVDAEEGGGEDVEEVGEPERHVGEEIAGGGVDGSDGALGDGVNAEPVREGNSSDFGGDVGNALRELVGEAAEVAQYGGQTGGEEECEYQGDADDEQDDGDGARGMVAAKVDLRDAGDGGHENDSEERADVEDQNLLLEGPGEGEEEKDGDRKEDVAADFSAGSLLVGGEVFGCGDGQPSSPCMLASGADGWMQLVCALRLGCGSAEFESSVRSCPMCVLSSQTGDEKAYLRAEESAEKVLLPPEIFLQRLKHFTD